MVKRRVIFYGLRLVGAVLDLNNNIVELFSSCRSQGFNAAGATSDIMMFAGNVKWRRSVFDTTGAPWQQVYCKLRHTSHSIVYI